MGSAPRGARRFLLRLGAASWGCLVLSALRVPEQSKGRLPGIAEHIASSRAARSDGSERITAYPRPQVMTFAERTEETAVSALCLSALEGTSNAV